MLETCILPEIFVLNYLQDFIQKSVENSWFGSEFYKNNPIIVIR